ncbi:titin-like [Solea solea]|uniref:titin-like n=1 Tax=Solea solea TaxID=90069 RepID=UPI00272ADB70|nr:titin-like [Solea solea]
MNVDVGIDQLLEKEAITEDSPSEETVTHKPNKASEFLTQYTDAEMEDKMQVDAQTEHFGENVLEAVQTKLDSKEDSSQLLEKEVTIEDTTEEETVTDKPEEETEPIIELDVKAEMENQILGDGVQIEHAEIQNVLESTATEETGPFNEYDVVTENKMTNAPQTEPTEEIQVLEVVQITTLNLEEVSGQLLEKEVTLGDIQAQETVTDKPNEETQPLAECDVQEETENRLQTDDAQTEQVLEAVQTATLDLEDNSGQLLAKQVISEDSAAGESITDKSNEDTQPLTEYDIAAETGNKFQEDAAQTLHTKEPHVLEAVQTATLNLEKDSGGQLLEEEVTSEDIQAQETDTNKPKEQTQPLTEHDVEEGTENRLQTHAAQTTRAGKPEVVQTATLDFEDSGQLLPKDVISEDIPAEETVKTEPRTEYNVAAEAENKLQTEAAQTEHTGEPEVLEAVETDTLVVEEGNLQTSNESEVPQAIPAPEIFDTDQATENLSEVSSKPDDKDLKRDAPNIDQVAEIIGAVSVQSLRKEVLAQNTEAVIDEAKEETEPLTEASELTVAIESEHVQDHEVAEDVILAQSAEDVTGHTQQPEVSPSNVNDTETSTETEVESSMAAQAVTESAEGGSANVLKVNEDQKTESTPHNAQVSQEDHIHEVVDEVQTVTAVCVSSVDDEASCVQVREKPVFSEVTPAALLENAKFTNERVHAQHLSAVQCNVEEEKGVIPGFEFKHAAVKHAIVAQVTTCHLKDVAAAIPDVLIETKSDCREPLIESVVSQVDCKETTETATPLVKKYVTVTEEDSSVVLMNVPLVEFKDNCQIQVQVLNVDIKSAEKTVDTALEVRITEAKEVIDVCHESVKEVDQSETEETVVHEETMVIIQEVAHHVESESVLVILEQEVIKQTDTVIETCKTAETELGEVEDQNVVGDTTVRERQEDVTAVASDESAAEEQMFKDLVQTPDIPGELDLDEEEEPKTEVEMPKVDVTTEEVRLLSDMKKINEETKITQITESQIVTPNAGLVVPQNTGIISSIGNVESPSSLSLEFKLNIQFGRAKEPASPPPTTERTEPMKKTEVSEVGVQAVEPEEEPEKKQKTTELVDVTVQGTEITETEPAHVEQTEMSTIANQPQLMDVGMQAVKTDEPAEQLKPTEKGTANVQVKETTETIIKNEKREVSLSPAGPAEVCEQETKAEEADQDVWMDAEEGVDNLEETEKSLHETDEPPEHQQESNQEEMSVPEPDFDRTSTSTVKEEENQQTLEQRGTFEIESEGEDFAVALEDSATATASTAIMEWD